MWTVIPRKDKRGNPEYVVVNTKDGVEVGTFDCEKWADTFAKELNGKEKAS